MLDHRIEEIFLAPERNRFLLPAGAASLVDMAQIAAGRERTVPSCREDDPTDRAVVAPIFQRRAQGAHHRARYCGHGGGPVTSDDSSGAGAVQQDFWFFQHGLEGALERVSTKSITTRTTGRPAHSEIGCRSGRKRCHLRFPFASPYEGHNRWNALAVLQ